MATESGSHGEFAFDDTPTDDSITFPDPLDDVSTDDPIDDGSSDYDPFVQDNGEIQYNIPNGDASGMNLNLFFSEGSISFDTFLFKGHERAFSMTFGNDVDGNDWQISWDTTHDTPTIVHDNVYYDLVVI